LATASLTGTARIDASLPARTGRSGRPLDGHGHAAPSGERSDRTGPVTLRTGPFGL